MDRFVVGFAFTEHSAPGGIQVLLMKKVRPEWQKGCLNGIGGKIEKNETPDAAMARECAEETGLALDWCRRGVLTGTNFDGRPFECHLYYAHSNAAAKFRQQEDEPLALYPLAALSRHKLVDSLDYLIPFGLSKDRKAFMTLTY